MPARPLLLAALLAPSLAAALPWDGTYRLSEEADCDKVGEEGGALRIAEGVLEGVDSTCRMTEPVDVLNLDATLYVLRCEGEGQGWSERAMFMKAAEGDALYIAWRGYVFRYDRCPAPEEASLGTEKPSGDEDAADGEESSGDAAGNEAAPAEEAAGQDAPAGDAAEDEDEGEEGSGDTAGDEVAPEGDAPDEAAPAGD